MQRLSIIAAAMLTLATAPVAAYPARSCTWTPAADDAQSTLATLREKDVPTAGIYFQHLWGQTKDCSTFAAGLGWAEARAALAETDPVEKAEWKKEARFILGRAAALDVDELGDARDAEAMLFADDLAAKDLREIGAAYRDGPAWRKDAARIALGRYLAKPFAESTPANMHAPARDAVAALSSALANADGAARTAIFDAACETNRTANGKVPDDIYAGVKPAGTAGCAP